MALNILKATLSRFFIREAVAEVGKSARPWEMSGNLVPSTVQIVSFYVLFSGICLKSLKWQVSL